MVIKEFDEFSLSLILSVISADSFPLWTFFPLSIAIRAYAIRFVPHIFLASHIRVLLRFNPLSVGIIFMIKVPRTFFPTA